ncbi:hypothetical protein HHI31_06100 [Campylobacter fetus subsp. venerealis]|uniref:hypothetical protein n=1 Tax=Campylobacter fetus TaxID=196 RepID=UPI0018E81AB5|nr:hypothetical protein [Campylobacter fetus]QQF52420.1 hypothetical protein HHI31_06100 [Campylobacter fetus subsp. venerealis]
MNLDPISAMSKVWSFFSKLNSGTVDLSSNTLSVSQLASMLESALSSNGTIFGNIVSKQNNVDELTKILTMGKISATSNYTMDIGAIRNVGGYQYGTTIGIENIKNNYRQDLGFNLESNSDEVTTIELFHFFLQVPVNTAQLTADAGLPTKSELV